MEQHEGTEPRTVDALVSTGDVVMLTTAADGMRSRPVTVAEVSGEHLAFLVSSSSDWVQTLSRDDSGPGPVIGLAYADPRSTTYVSLGARGRVSSDGARRAELWTPVAKAFFEGPDDPDLRVLEVEVTTGEWWDGPSTGVGRLVSLVSAAVRGGATVGEQGEVSVDDPSRRP